MALNLLAKKSPETAEMLSGMIRRGENPAEALNNYNQNQYILGQLGSWYSNPSVNPYTCYNQNRCGTCNGSYGNTCGN